MSYTQSTFGPEVAYITPQTVLFSTLGSPHCPAGGQDPGGAARGPREGEGCRHAARETELGRGGRRGDQDAELALLPHAGR